jgi:sulfur-oxidizing protein SoxY
MPERRSLAPRLALRARLRDMIGNVIPQRCAAHPGAAMKPKMDKPVLDRRVFLLGAGAVAAIVPFLAGRALAQTAPPAWEEALKRLVGEAQPTADGRVMLELPEIADNCNIVPFTISVESPMTEKEHVKAVHVISTANPLPTVATFRFTLLSGKASASSRMRLAQTQEVIGLAELNDGKFLMTRRLAKVAIGGCGA